jgi:hypothetical protein
MAYLEIYLAQIFDKFKADNPKLAAVLILFFGTLVYMADNGLPELIGYDMAVVVKWVSLVLGFMTGSRTTSLLKK